MPYIGKNPVGGGFHKLDSLTASATDTYALTLGSAAYYPESANQLLVSLNGVIQAPQDSFTVSGSNLVFDSALTASDSIDFVVALGDVLAVQTVTDGAITTAKLGNSAVTKAKIGTTELDLATIKDSTGTNTAMTVASNGVVTQNQLPLFYAHDVTNFAGASGWKSLNWTTKEETHKIDWDSTNYRIKPTLAGYYQIVFNHAHTGGSHTEYALRIEHSNYGRIANHEGAGSRQSISVVEYFDGSTDYITTDTYHSNSNHAEDNTDRRCNVGMFLVKGD